MLTRRLRLYSRSTSCPLEGRSPMNISSLILSALLVIGVGAVGLPVDAAKTHEEFPAKLSETGFVADMQKLRMAEGFVPYSVNVPAWADGANKERFMRLPAGKKATFRKKGAWQFPAGTIFLQNIVMPLESGPRRIETRVIRVEKDDLAFATYVWNDAQDEARLVKEGTEIGIESPNKYMLWKVTSTDDCTECHDASAQPLLSVSTKQLNLTHEDGKQQIVELAARGMVSEVPKELDSDHRLVDPFDAGQPLRRRARSYLDVNCSVCHAPGGNGSGTMDLRFDTPMSDTGMGHEDEVLIEGRPFSSWIYKRMIYSGRLKMPNKLTIHHDKKGSRLIQDWVESMDPD